MALSGGNKLGSHEIVAPLGRAECTRIELKLRPKPTALPLHRGKGPLTLGVRSVIAPSTNLRKLVSNSQVRQGTNSGLNRSKTASAKPVNRSCYEPRVPALHNLRIFFAVAFGRGPAAWAQDSDCPDPQSQNESQLQNKPQSKGEPPSQNYSEMRATRQAAPIGEADFGDVQNRWQLEPADLRSQVDTVNPTLREERDAFWKTPLGEYRDMAKGGGVALSSGVLVYPPGVSCSGRRHLGNRNFRDLPRFRGRRRR
jgi:hypothetical protein